MSFFLIPSDQLVRLKFKGRSFPLIIALDEKDGESALVFVIKIVVLRNKLIVV